MLKATIKSLLGRKLRLLMSTFAIVLGVAFVGGQGPPAIGGNYSDAPAGHDLPGLALTQGRPPRGPDEVVFDAKTA